MSSYWNYEDSDIIICPYCGEEYEPSYEDTYIGGEPVDCYTEDTETYTCDNCGKKFTMYGYQAGWNYRTETIEGQASDEEIEDLNNFNNNRWKECTMGIHFFINYQDAVNYN